MYKNKVCVIYWCPYGSCVMDTVATQFQIFFQFAFNISQRNFQKENHE